MEVVLNAPGSWHSSTRSPVYEQPGQSHTDDLTGCRHSIPRGTARVDKKLSPLKQGDILPLSLLHCTEHLALDCSYSPIGRLQSGGAGFAGRVGRSESPSQLMLMLDCSLACCDPCIQSANQMLGLNEFRLYM